MLYQDNYRAQDNNRDNNLFELFCWETIAPDANFVFSGGILLIEPVRQKSDGEKYNPSAM